MQMADATMLQKNAIVRNASIGATPPHGSVKTGELPLVQVKPPPGGPQVQEGQQKPVTILPPKDAETAVKTGGLPMVKVKMTDGKPKPDDGRDERVVIRDSRHGSVSAGALPMVQVKMTDGGRQIQTLPHVQEGPPQIPAAMPALSALRPPQASPPARQGYVALPAGPVVNQARVARVASPHVARVSSPQVALPSMPEFSMDQLMLLRHLVDKYLGELASAEVPVEATEGADASAEKAASVAAAFAVGTLATIDDMLVSTAVRAEAAANAAVAVAASPVAAIPVPAVPTQAVPSTSSIAPAPSVAYNAGRVNARPFVAAGARAQRNAGMAPRRTARAPLPPVIVKMEGQQAVVQNRAEIEQAKAAVAAATAAEPTDLSGQVSALAAENEALRRELEQARAIPTGVDPAASDGNAQG